MKKPTYYAYKITNTKTNKSYVGIRITWSKIETDNYMGSSKYLHKEIESYGQDNFTKQVLQTFKTEREMLDSEGNLILEHNTIYPHGLNYWIPTKDRKLNPNHTKRIKAEKLRASEQYPPPISTREIKKPLKLIALDKKIKRLQKMVSVDSDKHILTELNKTINQKTKLLEQHQIKLLKLRQNRKHYINNLLDSENTAQKNRSYL